MQLNFIKVQYIDVQWETSCNYEYATFEEFSEWLERSVDQSFNLHQSVRNNCGKLGLSIN